MSLKDLRDYITQHLKELKEELSDQIIHDSHSDYLEGAIEAYQHILGKLD